MDAAKRYDRTWAVRSSFAIQSECDIAARNKGAMPTPGKRGHVLAWNSPNGNAV